MKKILMFVVPAVCAAAIAGVVIGMRHTNWNTPAQPTGLAVSSSEAPAPSKITPPPAPKSTAPPKVAAPPKDRPNSIVTQEAAYGKPSHRKVAYLTFDDGPSRLTPKLLNTLNSNHVPATFFVVGLQAQQYPDTLRQIVNCGDAIGVHSWTHQYSYIYKNTQNFLTDFNQLKDYIQQVTGVTPNICRFPGGTNNTVFRHYNKDHIMGQIVTLVEGMGFKYYDWNVSSGEASSVPPSKDTIVKRVTAQCRNKTTAVILFHDTENQGYIDALPPIIARLRSMGFAFDTLSPDNPSGADSKPVQFPPL